MSNSKTPILHFSDVLCIYAHVAQARMVELSRAFGEAIDVAFHFCSVFGDVERKLRERWGDRGGASGYNAYVLEVAQRYPHVTVHPEIWTKSTPRSSLAPHLFLCAIQVVENREEAEPGAFTHAIAETRRAFFEHARDVASKAEQAALLEELAIAPEAVRRAIDTGAAHAVLGHGLELARKYDVTLSPTLILNEGRQRLNGNVGFRIIEANVRELLRSPTQEASWC